MIGDIRKSLSSILYERVSSPLYGTFIFSWAVCNWKILVLVLFVKEEKISTNKIEYISSNLISLELLVYYPAISTALMLTALPFLSNGAYWLHLKFTKWKTDKKHEVEMSTLLTLEQSIQLREEIRSSEERLEKIVEGKNSEIRQLNAQLEELRKENESPIEKDLLIGSSSISKAITNSYPTSTEVDRVSNKILENPKLQEALDIAVEYIQGGYSGLLESKKISPSSLAFLEANDLVESNGEGTYTLTRLGKDVLKVILDKRY